MPGLSDQKHRLRTHFLNAANQSDVLVNGEDITSQTASSHHRLMIAQRTVDSPSPPAEPAEDIPPIRLSRRATRASKRKQPLSRLDHASFPISHKIAAAPDMNLSRRSGVKRGPKSSSGRGGDGGRTRTRRPRRPRRGARRCRGPYPRSRALQGPCLYTPTQVSAWLRG